MTLSVTLASFRFIMRRDKPLFAAGFSLPDRNDIDARLLLGAVLFGIGWGLYGYCPGPAIAALVYLEPVTVVFVVAMLAGMTLANKLG